MSIFNAINTSASALTAQRLRMDVVSSNIANAHSTRQTTNDNGEWEPYRRKLVSFQSENPSFKSHLQREEMASGETTRVKASVISEDQRPFKTVFNPAHPDANEAGFVLMPNVDPLQEMVDLMSATRSYEANITALNASKSMLMKTSKYMGMCAYALCLTSLQAQETTRETAEQLLRDGLSGKSGIYGHGLSSVLARAA